MEKKEINIEHKKSLLSLESRRKLILTGIIEVVSFNEDQIVLNTNLGTLNIKGKDLKMNKLDVQNGDVVIIGVINACVYTSSEPKKKRQNLISKIFK
ncbi:sporulation protein YabP [Clostridium kluyveri]|uniref:Sporulation protein YabP n=1 Tax=Clostridium kluyveri TaxID=1534 RepID=A0A1L5F3T3_CLOKL|nr:sporulation protein YabP [Clostridium kluyveri]APM37510.1 sporulation protein YabP [Clostridium kluyveri]UZQ52530.1 sporulation protein YabP [Clostridium kluyveri]